MRFIGGNISFLFSFSMLVLFGFIVFFMGLGFCVRCCRDGFLNHLPSHDKFERFRGRLLCYKGGEKHVV